MRRVSCVVCRAACVVHRVFVRSCDRAIVYVVDMIASSLHHHHHHHHHPMIVGTPGTGIRISICHQTRHTMSDTRVYVDTEGTPTPEVVSEVDEMILCVPDFPREGIMFRDITTLISHPSGLALTTKVLAAHYAAKGVTIDAVVGCEARGFIWGATLAMHLGVGLVVLRKKGKLPRETYSADYSLEYGEASLEIHTDALQEGANVVIVDDLLATGGTMLASVGLVRKAGGNVVGTAFISDLPDLGGRAKLQDKGIPVFSIVSYPGE